MMDLQTVVKGFIDELARRDGARAVPESEVRGAIKGYVKCMSIAYRRRGELSAAQLDRAVRYYHRRRVDLHRRPPLLAA